MNKRFFKKTGIVLLSLAGLITVLSGCKKEQDKTYERAISAYHAGFYEDAINGYKTAISQGEDEAVIYADMALAYAKAGNTDEAVRNIDLALSMAPKDKKVLKRVGIFYYDAGDYDVALSYFLKAQPENGEKETEADYENDGYMASVRRKRGEWEQAVVLYNRMILGSYHVKAHEILAGDCYLQMHQFKAASQYFDMVKENRDVSPADYLYIYHACRQAGDFTDAEKYFELGRALTGPEKEMSESEYYARAGLYAEAMKAAASDSTVGAALSKAWILVMNGDYDGADAIYQNLIIRGKDLPSVYAEYMTLKVLKNDVSGAEELLSTIRTFNDGDALKAALWNEIILHEKTADFEHAYEKLLSFTETYGENEDTERELRFLERALLK